jgi:hypothetical protein
MLNVFFTVDTEIWCDKWETIDEEFADAFLRYVYGPTSKGNAALPLTFDILNEHGLTGSFFVESLFAHHFGLEPLQELTGLIQNAGHEVQLHLHPEWVNEAKTPIFEQEEMRRPYLRDFTLEQQTLLVKHAKNTLLQSGVESINAFRAGGYGADRNTLRALAANDIQIDTSYNPADPIGIADISPDKLLLQPSLIDGITEYPVTVFGDKNPRSLRPMQLTACSYTEFETILFHAVEHEWDSVVIVSHNFELMTPGLQRLDPIILSRFKRLCKLLSNHPDLFTVRGFNGLEPYVAQQQPEIPVSGAFNTNLRIGSQILRRFI